LFITHIYGVKYTNVWFEAYEGILYAGIELVMGEIPQNVLLSAKMLWWFCQNIQTRWYSLRDLW